MYFGWVIRYLHRNGASFVFIILFIHFFRGILQGSFLLKGPWARGWLIILIIIASAFLGYVLPWGQISFWGATVIINLISILPKGKVLVVWLWGGFYVSSFTCSFFFAFHYIIPLVVLVIVIVHIVILHYRGRTGFGGAPRSGSIKVKFRYLFLIKDIVNLIILWRFLIWTLLSPDWASDPVNFIPSDLRSRPIHIQPEWYFLHLYAVLRSIPNKLGGLIGFFIAILLILILVFVDSKISLNHFKFYNLLAWIFIITNLLLIWLGIQAVEEPFIFMGGVSSFIYFRYIFGVLIFSQINNLVFS